MDEESTIGRMFGAGRVSTFLGLPVCDDLATLDADAAIIGAPCVTPYHSVGPYCIGAPRAIREAIAPYAASVHHVDFDLGAPIFPDPAAPGAVDCGDLPYDEVDFAANRARVRDAVRGILDRGAVPVLLGGDDSAPIPMLEAYGGRAEIHVVQIDAHIDWRDEVDGERYGLSSNMRRASEMEHVAGIVQIGQRAIGSARPQDLADARAWGAELVPARELERHGVAPVLERIPDGADVVLALDVDGLDPAIVPAVIGRAPGGLGYWQTVEIVHGIAARGRLAGFSLVELVPERDVDGLGALVAARIVANVLGAIARA